MRKITMLAATAGAVLVVAGCGSSHVTARPQAHAPAASTAHPLTLAPVATPALYVKDSADRTACLTWRRWAGTSDTASLPTVAATAAGEASDPAFKRDAAAAVADYRAAQVTSDRQTNDVLQMASDIRDADNDCAADGIAIDGMTS